MNLDEKIILITGATDGLGKLVAQHAAEAGATVILHGRNKQKGEQTRAMINTSTGNKNIFYHNADFSSLAEVKRFSEEILANHGQLHVLINNAAIGGGPKGSQERELSKDGYELRFAVNYLSHFLLTKKLLPLLKASAPARIVNIASIGQSPFNFSDVQMEKNFDSYEAYARSKLAQISFGFELAEQLEGGGITVNSLHPATLMNTNMVADYFGRTSSTVEEGAGVVEHVAFSKETENVTGTYFDQFRQARAHSQACDAEARKKLWQLSEELTKAFQ